MGVPPEKLWLFIYCSPPPEVKTCLAMAMAAIVAMAAAIVTIANVVMAAVVEPQQSWS